MSTIPWALLGSSLAHTSNALTAAAHIPATPTVTSVWVRPQPSSYISPFLASMSLVYCWARDAQYGNGTLGEWAQRHGIKTARYPAGTASYWNWEAPTGQMGNSSLDPAWKGPPAPQDQWMNFSEYLSLCRGAGLTPLVGVNYNCKTKEWVNESDSITRATRQVQFALDAGFSGGMWYIGNEDDASEYAKRIAAHANAMKLTDPSLKTFWNDNNLNPKSLTHFLQATGQAMDGAEFHGKWPFGGKPGLPPGTFDEWMVEVPLVERKSNQTWRQKIKLLRAAAKKAGRPDLLLANNEFGLGKPSDLVGFNRYTKSLVVVEFAMEMYVAGYDVAAFWDNSDGGSLDHGDQMLMDSSHAFRMNPMHFGLELLAQAAGGNMLSMNTSQPRVHGFAALPRNASLGGEGPLLVYLLNKFQAAMPLQMTLPLPAPLPTTSSNLERLTFSGPVACQVRSLVDTPDHWGQLTGPDACSCSPTSAALTELSCSFTLPALSFSLFEVLVE